MKTNVIGYDTPELVLVDLATRLRYPLMGYDGAISEPWLERRVLDVLKKADRQVSKISQGHARILVWDALRTRACQQDIWRKYAAQLRIQYRDAAEEEIQTQVARFVGNPAGIFRHGTGGAVDVTLLIDGVEANLGTPFDEFSGRAAANYFQKNVPITSDDREADINRKLLHTAMLDAGFVVLPEEWWHFEFGTEMWAQIKSQTAFLTKVLTPPTFSRFPAEIVKGPKSMPTYTTGVSQAFGTPEQRQAALNQDRAGHYYARTSTPSRTDLENTLCSTFTAEYAVTTSSGISACLVAARALIPPGTSVLVADTAYYEVALRLHDEAGMRGWHLCPFNAEVPECALSAIKSVENDATLVVWLDQPSNWWLGATKLECLATAVKEKGGVVIADCSVHPYVPALADGADACIISLSKFPSNGLVQGGVVLTNDNIIAEKLLRQRAHDASSLAAGSCFTISQHLSSLADRFAAVSYKTAKLAELAKTLPGICAVRIANMTTLGTKNIGGILVLETDIDDRGKKAEEIIAQNFHREDFPLTLQCTFGGMRTCFEHFQHRGLSNNTGLSSLVKPLPGNFCRVGVGNERFEWIRDALALVFPS